jgi:hypothetical protein
MNLALSALLIILILLPAYSFRIGVSFLSRRIQGSETIQDITSRNISKPLSKLNFTETVFLFSFIPLVLHFFSLFILHLLGCHIDYSLLLNILSGKQNVLTAGADESFHQKLLLFLLYTLVETAIACTTGLWLVYWTGNKEWLLHMLAGNNIWYKLFSGASLSNMQKKELANVLVEALVETKETTVIYSGLLKSYETAENGDDLAYITLTGTYRRDLRKAQSVTKAPETSSLVTTSYYDVNYGDIIPIPGHTFTLPGKEIMNVNVTYMKQELNMEINEVRLVPILF